MIERPTRVEGAFAEPAAHFLDLDESALDLIALAVEGNTYGLLGTVAPQLQKKRVVVVAQGRVYLISRSYQNELRELLWEGRTSEVRRFARRWRSSTLHMGGYEVTVWSPADRRLDQYLEP